MKQIANLLIFLIFTVTSYSQKENSANDFNLGFENIHNGKPDGWVIFGTDNYKICIDSTIVKSGKYAASIELKSGNSNFNTWAVVIPQSYNGKNITLSGYIKTENVRDGYAGLWMRIDPEIGFDNMEDKGIKGTTDWTKYEIALKLDPKNTTQIVIGGVLTGKGKIWLDDFNLTIDGKNIYNASIFKSNFPADNDHEFDSISKINTIDTKKENLDKLYELGLIWGFLKYYHPNIAKGNFNWDYELFRILPKILSSASKDETNKIFVEWINKLGPFKECKEPKFDNKNVKIYPDLEWIQKSGFSKELTDILLKVKTAKRCDKNYYISYTPYTGNPQFNHENSFKNMKYPDAGFRILALYRYWNMIQYFYPYKNLIGEDWKEILKEFIPKLINNNDETSYALTMLELIGNIHDTHANIWGKNDVLFEYFGKFYAAPKINFIENKAVVVGFYNDTLGKASGMKIGDIITKIKNVPVDEIIKSNLKYTPASNYPTQLRNLAMNLLRSNDTLLYIEYIRNGNIENRNVKTYPTSKLSLYEEHNNSDTCFKFVDKDIAYINNSSVKNTNLPLIWEKMENAKGLIIDNRNYPSDFVIYSLCNYLMPVKTDFVKFSFLDIKYPGYFIIKTTNSVGKKNKDFFKGKVIILVNEITQSSSEFHAMAYRVAPKAIVIGSTTAGADGNVSMIALPGYLNTYISGIGVYYPDGSETQRIGIVPNIEVKPTIEGIKAGKDEVLEKAIEIINQEK